MKVIVSLAAAASLLVLSAVPALAFVNTGHKQPDTTVTYWMYTGVAADQTAYLNGKSTWNTATLIAFVSSGHVDTEEVGLTSVNNNGVQWDGLTTTFFNGNGIITYATVRLNDFYTNGYSAGKRQSVAAHELGHTLGLGDVSGGAELMNGKTCGTSSRWCSFFINAPETDDINGINAIY